MGFGKSLKRVGKAVATGGLSEAANLLKPNTATVDQVPLETPEQREARQSLLAFSKTGKLGNFQAGGAIAGYDPGADIYPDIGKSYSGDMGDYGMTNLEGAGQNKLMSLLNSGNPDIFNAGKNELNNLLSTDKYDPYSATGVYSGFKVDAEREAQDAADSVKRNAAFGGTLYNSDTVRSLGRLGEVTGTNLQNKLAELYDTFAQRKISAIPMAFQAGQQEQDMNLGLVGASQQYGGLSRILNDTDLQRKYQEFVRSQSAGYGEAVRKRGEVTSDASRRRAEEAMPLTALSAVAGQNANFGVPSVTTTTPNPWDNVLNLLATGAGAALGSRPSAPAPAPAPAA